MKDGTIITVVREGLGVPTFVTSEVLKGNAKEIYSFLVMVFNQYQKTHNSPLELICNGCAPCPFEKGRWEFIVESKSKSAVFSYFDSSTTIEVFEYLQEINHPFEDKFWTVEKRNILTSIRILNLFEEISAPI